MTTDKNRLSMFLFLLSEAAFFGVLIMSYLYYYPSYVGERNSPLALNPPAAPKDAQKKKVAAPSANDAKDKKKK